MQVGIPQNQSGLGLELSAFMHPKDIRDLTGYTMPAKQISALREMGIPFRVRPDGRPVVLREAAYAALGKQFHAPKASNSPDFSSL